MNTVHALNTSSTLKKQIISIKETTGFFNALYVSIACTVVRLFTLKLRNPNFNIKKDDAAQDLNTNKTLKKQIISIKEATGFFNALYVSITYTVVHLFTLKLRMYYFYINCRNITRL